MTLHRIPLPEQVRDVLLGRIVDGRYAAGQRLVETRIARELDVSQGPVREALRELAGMGMVEHLANRGYRVRAIDQREIDDVSVVRAALEETAAGLAAVRGVDPVPLEAAVTAMRVAAAAGNGRTWITAAVRFHRLLVEAADNEVLLSCWEGLAIEGRTAQLVLIPGFDLVAQAEGHQRILDAVLGGDAVLAARLSREHEESFTSRPPS